MIMRDQDTTKLRQINSRLQTLAADAAVDQQRRSVLFDDVGVALR